MPSKLTTRPHASVVGAGIAGLSAAIGLRRAGWVVDVFERSGFKNEIGAAISVPPNATCVLDRWGFDFIAAGAVPNQAMRIADARDLSTLVYMEYTDHEATLGHASWTLHRVDLHKALRALAVEERSDGEKGVPVRIRLGCHVQSVDCERALVRLADGSEMVHDLVIIADGGHVQPLGWSIYRWLVPIDHVLVNPELAALYSRPALPGFHGWLDSAEDVFWVSYTCRAGRILNNAVLHRTRADEAEETGNWHRSVTKDHVREKLSNFHAAARGVIDMASEDGIKVHPLFRREALDSFVCGRAAIVGDAAHVMMPSHAAGAGISIESAATLQVLMCGVDGRDGDELRRRLRLFDQLRVPRCNLTMLVSNAGRDCLKLPGLEHEIRKYYDGPLPPKTSLPWSPEFVEVLFHHDEFKTAEAALASGRGGAAERTERAAGVESSTASASECTIGL